MAKTIVEQVMAAHLVSGELVPGAEVALKIDHTLTQDATGTLAYLEFEAMGVDAGPARGGGELCGPQSAPDGFSQRRRPPVFADGGGPLRPLLFAAGQRHQPPGAPGAVQRPGQDLAGVRQPHAHGRGRRDAGLWGRGAGRGPGPGRAAFLSGHARDPGGAADGAVSGPGCRPRTSSWSCCAA